MLSRVAVLASPATTAFVFQLEFPLALWVDVLLVHYFKHFLSPSGAFTFQAEVSYQS